MTRTIAALCAIAALAAAPVQSPRKSGEAATARQFAAIRSDPPRLRAFLREMPKGGDLHNHLSGAIYAESYLKWASDDHLCLATATMTIVAGECSAEAGQLPVGAVLRNATVYNQAIDAMSMRHWNPSLNGHDHFFAAFGKFGPESQKFGDMAAEIAARAAAEHVSYLELMLTPAGASTQRIARSIGWMPNLAELRGRLEAAGFRDAVVAEARQRLDALEARERELLGCGTPRANPGCAVTLRFIAQVPRAAALEDVFGAMLAGFQIATADSRVVSVNLVQPEDDPSAIANFDVEMSMFDFLHREYPRVPITLHAGELTEGLVPPEALRSHIRQSIEIGHALRIGHGVDVMDEDDPRALLREMAAKKVLVEIALTSNDQILGVKAARHPLHDYLRQNVPVALVTDDMGVARSTHTDEFLKAAEEQGLDYLTLKKLARNSIEYAFADGATRKRLTLELDKAFQDFESRWR